MTDRIIFLRVEARVDAKDVRLCGKSCPHLTRRGPNSNVKDACSHFMTGNVNIKYFAPLILLDGARAMRLPECESESARDGGEEI